LNLLGIKAYSVDLRQKILDTYQAGGISQRQLSERFRVTLSFIEKLLKQYRDTGSIAPKVRTKQTPIKLTSAQLEALAALVKANSDATLAKLQEQLRQSTSVIIGRSTVARMLSKLNLTRKKTLHPTEKVSDRVQRERAKYWQLIQGILAKDMIFIDESGINLAMTRLFASSPKGERARGKRPSKRGQNISLIGAIGLKGLVTQVALLGSTDRLTFEAFISQKLGPKLWKGACVIMDNCSIYLGEDIEAWIKKAGAKLIYLPPYLPDFSPIENCWSKIKNILRSIGARNYPNLAKAIEDAFAEVSLDDLRGWFTHCCYCTSVD
jgi:transposase